MGGSYSRLGGTVVVEVDVEEGDEVVEEVDVDEILVLEKKTVPSRAQASLPKLSREQCSIV